MATTVDEMVVKWSMDSSNFQNGITKLNRSMNVLKSEFNATDSELKNYGDTTERLKNKQEYLTKAMDLQKKKIETLKASYEKAKEETGENSDETEKLAIKVNNAVKYYNNLEGKLKDVSNELETNSSSLKENSNQIENQGSKWEGLQTKLGNLGGKLSSLGSTLTTKVTVPLTALFGVATKGTEELRNDMSKLETMASQTNNSWKDVNEEFKQFNAISNETDSSIEALNNLMNAGLQGNSLSQAVDLLSGAVVAFPDTMKIESLADSLQETVATSAATGQFSELLGRCGINVDKFNEGLENCKSKNERLDYAMQTLASTGLATINGEWEKNNQDLIENSNSQLTLQESLAKLGETLTPILTTLTNGLSKVLNVFNNLSPTGQKIVLVLAGLAMAIGPVLSVLGSLVTVISAINVAMLPTLGTIALVVAAIAAVIAIGVLLYKNWDTIKEKATQLKDWVVNKVIALKDGVVNAVSKIVDFFKNNWQGILLFIVNPFAGAFKLAYDNCESFRNKVNAVIDKMKNVFATVQYAITHPFETAKNIVSGIIDSIKQKFNFNWSLPKIKLPHFSIKGNFSLKPPSVPHFAVDWYSSGAIFTKPTILGAIGVGDAYNGLGSNAEAVIPLNSMYSNLRNIVKEEIANSNNDIYITINDQIYNETIAKRNYDYTVNRLAKSKYK